MTNRKHNGAGGAATAGGINFQAAVTAIINIHIARGRPLGWLPDCQDIPRSVDAETGGPGDDVACTLADGTRVEVQVKKGLTATGRLWTSLLDLAHGIAKQECDWGVLVVCPNSSSTIRDKLARDIQRIGSGRRDGLSCIGETLLAKLKQAGLDEELTCRRLAIQTIPALANDQTGIQAAKAELGHICSSGTQIDQAWAALLQDTSALIEQRGRTSLSRVAMVLQKAGVGVSAKDSTGPLGSLDKLFRWNHQTNEKFSIFGVARRLDVGSDWIELSARARTAKSMQAQLGQDLKLAIESYHNWHRAPSENDQRATSLNPETLGRFVKRGIIVAGPGMGKTTLLKRIARRYAEDNIPVLKVRLSAVAADIKNGASFEEAIFKHGLDGSGLAPQALRSAGFSNWLFLGDGLDECGDMQEQIADGISRFAKGYPDSRVLITTRPIGYLVSHFLDWRHYDLLPLDPSYAPRYIGQLWQTITGVDEERADYEEICKKELPNEPLKEAVGRTPLMIALAAAILSRGQSLGGTREALFDQVFSLVDQAPVRSRSKPASQPVLTRFLNLVGWLITRFPLLPRGEMVEACAKKWVAISGQQELQALENCELYLAYWEDAGLLEKVGHASTQVYCFVIKSFGEYLAARHLARLADNDELPEIRSALGDPEWDNVLRFAGRLGLGSLIAEMFTELPEKDRNWHLKLIDVVHIVAMAEPEVSVELRQRIFDDAFSVVAGKDRQDAYALAMPLAECTERYPIEIAEFAFASKDSEQSWSRLVAWHCLLRAGWEHFDVQELQALLADSLEQVETGMIRSLGGGIIFGRGEGFELRQSFVLEACVQIYARASRDVSDDLIPRILNDKRLDTLSFKTKAEELIAAQNWPYRIKYDLGNLSSFKVPDGFTDAQKAGELFMLDALGAAGSSERIEEKPPTLLHLSAFMQASKWWETPTGDCWAWAKEFDRAAVTETIRVMAELTGIDTSALREEAIAAKAYLLADQDENDNWLGGVRFFSIVEHVDCPDVDWSLAKSITFDEDLVEKALFHTSQWVVWMAGNIVEERFDQKRLQECIVKIYEHGSGHSLWAAGCLLAALPKDVAVGMTIQRLKQDLVWGARYLYTALQELDVEMSADLMDALVNGLSSRFVKNAVAAAELIEHLARKDCTELMPLIQSSLEYWLEHEEPYPSKGGTVPDSPRAHLVGAWLKIEVPDLLQFRKWLDDTRSDVRDQGKQALKAWVAKDRSHFGRYLDSLEKADFSPQTLGWILQQDISLRTEDVARVEGLLSNEDCAVRFNAMAILESHFLSAKDIEQHLQKLVDDPEQQIQDRARSKLKKSEK